MTSYADAAPRFARWLRKYQSDRKAHAQARRAHPDPAVLDAEFAHVIHDMRILGLRTKVRICTTRQRCGGEDGAP